MDRSHRNRNLYLEGFAGDDTLPAKWNLLKYERSVIGIIPTRLYNLSPIGLNLDEQSDEQELLFDSGFDIAKSFNSYNGISFKDHAKVRSLFMEEFSVKTLKKLDILVTAR